MFERVLADGDDGERRTIDRCRSRLRAALGGAADGRADVLASLSERYRTSPRLAPLRTVAFWVAIVLPFVHLPLLVTGLSSRSTFGAFVILLGLNFLALVAGFDHQP